ncbi:MAG: hypothetical protein ACTHOU_01530 [Aureliella sp.]
MARAYSGVLSAMAVVFVILRGLLLGMLPDEILGMCLVVFAIFAAVGYVIGSIADRTVCESVENRFRSEIARLQTTPSAPVEKAE